MKKKVLVDQLLPSYKLLLWQAMMRLSRETLSSRDVSIESSPCLSCTLTEEVC